MKQLLAPSFLLLLLPACGEQANAAMAHAQKMAGQAADAVKNLAGTQTTFTDLTRLLGGVTDAASAEKVKAQLTTLVDSFRSQLGALGGLGQFTSGLGGSADGLLKAAKEQVTKLVGNPEVAKTLGPVLEQLKGLLGS